MRKLTKIAEAKDLVLLLSNTTSVSSVNTRINFMLMYNTEESESYKLLCGGATNKGVYDAVHAINLTLTPLATMFTRKDFTNIKTLTVKCENYATFLILTRQISSTEYTSKYITKVVNKLLLMAPNVKIVFEPTKGCIYLMNFFKGQLSTCAGRKKYVENSTHYDYKFVKAIEDRKNAIR